MIPADVVSSPERREGIEGAVDPTGDAAVPAGRAAKASAHLAVRGPFELIVERGQLEWSIRPAERGRDQRIRDVRIPRQEGSMEIRTDPQPIQAAFSRQQRDPLRPVTSIVAAADLDDREWTGAGLEYASRSMVLESDDGAFRRLTGGQL
jgi:hypothetical protein